MSQRGWRSQVRESGPVVAEQVPAPTVVRARMPAPEERVRFDLPDGVPVLVVSTDSGEAVHPADHVEIRVCSESRRSHGSNPLPPSEKQID